MSTSIVGCWKLRRRLQTHKGKEWEEKRLFPPNLEAIERWLNDRRYYGEAVDPDNPIDQSGSLFFNQRGETLTRDGLQCLLKRLGKRAGIKTSPHDFRRGGISHMVNMGVPDRLIMLQSGHKTHRVFEKYARGAKLSALDQWFGGEDPTDAYRERYGWQTLDEMLWEIP